MLRGRGAGDHLGVEMLGGRDAGGKGAGGLLRGKGVRGSGCSDGGMLRGQDAERKSWGKGCRRDAEREGCLMEVVQEGCLKVRAAQKEGRKGCRRDAGERGAGGVVRGRDAEMEGCRRVFRVWDGAGSNECLGVRIQSGFSGTRMHRGREAWGL